MATKTAQQNSDFSVTVKNTFLDLKRKEEDPTKKRSSSVPCAFKLAYVSLEAGQLGKVDISDDSTIASDKDISESAPIPFSDSEEDYPDGCSDCTVDDIDFAYTCVECVSDGSFGSPAITDKVTLSIAELEVADTSASKVTLTLDDMVKEGAEKVRAKLRAQARPFQSARTPPAEVSALIAKVVSDLSQGPDICDVQVSDGGMGGTTIVQGKSSSSSPNTQVLFALVKDTLLKGAEASECTYILGYGGQAFKNLDSLSFSANISCMPAAHHETACWDTYEKGYCPRRCSCGWTHPDDADTMRLIVMVTKQA
jgi:hypothetical protein